jgi:hypothetical protein
MKIAPARLTAAVLLLATSAFAQMLMRETPIHKADVPNAVLEAFRSAYPKASTRSYTKVEVNGTTFYKIESVDGKDHREVSYTPAGELAKIQELVAESGLPAEAQQAIADKYPNAKVTRAEKIIEGDRVGYRAVLKTSGKLFDLEFDASGKLTHAREVKISLVFR